MPEIPVLLPARISLEFGYRRIVPRIRVKDVALRPVRNDSLRDVRRGLAHEHVGRQHKHNSDKSSFGSYGESSRPPDANSIAEFHAAPRTAFPSNRWPGETAHPRLVPRARWQMPTRAK